jgi:hypothetical protein
MLSSKKEKRKKRGKIWAKTLWNGPKSDPCGSIKAKICTQA